MKPNWKSQEASLPPSCYVRGTWLQSTFWVLEVFSGWQCWYFITPPFFSWVGHEQRQTNPRYKTHLHLSFLRIFAWSLNPSSALLCFAVPGDAVLPYWRPACEPSPEPKASDWLVAGGRVWFPQLQSFMLQCAWWPWSFAQCTLLFGRGSTLSARIDRYFCATNESRFITSESKEWDDSLLAKARAAIEGKINVTT